SLVTVGDAGKAQFSGTVGKSAFLGASQHCEVALAQGGTLKLAIPPNRQVEPGEPVGIAVALEQAWVMPEVAP
ncbi:TOBE domain-containing protein, partial [Klebsiella pneumoniae]|uniref:TOBE domain-containing protein n=1 Tax=Klebsiella pneumoniae TaxID=573 RepID=UPI0013D85551